MHFIAWHKTRLHLLIKEKLRANEAYARVMHCVYIDMIDCSQTAVYHGQESQLLHYAQYTLEYGAIAHLMLPSTKTFGPGGT